MPTEEEQNAYYELTAWTFSLGDAEFIHQHVVDAWGAQNATEDSRPISVTFSLIGLYLHLERGFSGRQVQRVHMQLAQPRGRGPGRKELPHFIPPSELERITVRDVLAAPEKERTRAIDRWCQSVWEAWKDSQAAVAEFAERDLGIRTGG